MNIGSKTAICDEVVHSPHNYNESLIGMECLRCGKFYQTGDPHVDSGLGCGACLNDGFPVSLRCKYDAGSKLYVDREQSGMLRFVSKLPFTSFPSLGEGQTALTSMPRLAMEFGVQQVCIKNEGQNPTGSHKDRMSPLAIARAISAGYSKVLASSSGNAGASLASYAARAGLKCCIIVGKDISRAWEDAIRLSGAAVQRHDSHERWPQMQEMVQKDGWFPVTNFWPTPIGSNPFGIEGYKTIAYEIVEQHKGAPPTLVMVPTCRGDVLFGISRGFAEAVEAGIIEVAPRLVAVEPGSRLELVLNGADYRTVFEVAGNNMTSIDGGTVTYQSWMALQSCNGTAVSVTSEDAKSAQRELAIQGFHVETSSASALAGLRQLQKRGQLNPSDRVVMLITSHGYKEPIEQSVPSTNRLCN